MGNAFLVSFERGSFEHKMLKIGGHAPKTVWQGMGNLRSRGLLRKNGGRYHFTQKGKKWVEASQFKHLKIEPHPWDGKWRVVIFDIPESLRTKRELFRSKLKSLDFHMVQKSVFAMPFRCEKEIAIVCDYLEIEEYANVLICESLGDLEHRLKRQYDLA